MRPGAGPEGVGALAVRRPAGAYSARSAARSRATFS